MTFLDLHEIQVQSVEEAFQVLAYGRRNRRVAATRQNKDSSRRSAQSCLTATDFHSLAQSRLVFHHSSHCIFTVKLVRLPDVDEPHYATVSRLSLVDLAGSERHNNTKATGGAIGLKIAGGQRVDPFFLGFIRSVQAPSCVKPAISTRAS